MADTLKNGFTYTDASQESKFINIILDGNNVQTGENSNLNQTLEKNESKQEKTQEKTISCLTALSIDKIGSNNGMQPAYF